MNDVDDYCQSNEIQVKKLETYFDQLYEVYERNQLL